MSDFLELGSVLRLHGFRGAMVVKSSGEEASALSYLREVYLEIDGQLKSLSIEEASWMPKGWKLVLQGFNSETLTRKLIGKKVFSKREALRELPKNEFYVSDLIGTIVLDANTNIPIGTVVKIDTFGCQDRWWVSYNKREVGIPAVGRYIERVDPLNRTVSVKNFSELVEL